MTKRIPNLNTVSTLLDRLSIENVKVAHFENAIEHDNLDDKKKNEFGQKVATQNEIILALKKELVDLLEEVLTTGKYEYVKEQRTFT